MIFGIVKQVQTSIENSIAWNVEVKVSILYSLTKPYQMLWIYKNSRSLTSICTVYAYVIYSLDIFRERERQTEMCIGKKISTPIPSCIYVLLLDSEFTLFTTLVGGEGYLMKRLFVLFTRFFVHQTSANHHSTFLKYGFDLVQQFSHLLSLNHFFVIPTVVTKGLAQLAQAEFRFDSPANEYHRVLSVIQLGRGLSVILVGS